MEQLYCGVLCVASLSDLPRHYPWFALNVSLRILSGLSVLAVDLNVAIFTAEPQRNTEKKFVCIAAVN